MAWQARGKVIIDVRRVQRLRAMRGVVSAQVPGTLPELSRTACIPRITPGEDCTGCGICFYCCPEPGAITVYRVKAPRQSRQAAQGGHHAATL